MFIPYRKNITPSRSKEFWLPLEKGKYKVFSPNSFCSTSIQNPNIKVSKENKTFTILIFIQNYSSKLWVNFSLKILWISKNSKLESCRYLSHGFSPSSLVSIGFFKREIHPKYWSNSTSLICFLIWSFQTW